MLQLFYICVGLLGAILCVCEFNTLSKEAFLSQQQMHKDWSEEEAYISH